MKVTKKDNKSAQEWMSRLCPRQQIGNYNECARMLAEQFIHGLDENGMIIEILRKVSTLEGNNDAMSERVLLWAPNIEAQRAQKEVLNNIRG